MKIALLGLGIMGQALAARLLEAGFSLTVWNRTLQKAHTLRSKGATVAETPASAVAGADIVALCLTDKHAVAEVLFGEAGAVYGATSGAPILDFSTLGIAPTLALADRVAKAVSCDWVDAPVSGGPSAASAGQLAIFCGGTVAAIARVQPVLTALSRVCTHMGPVGAGQATKLCNQLIVSTTVMALAEAFAAGKALGLDVARLPQALAGGYADSTPLQVFGPRMATLDLVPRISEVATMRKDVKEIAAAVAELPIDLRLMRTVENLYDVAMARDLGGEDLGALVRLPIRQP